MTSNDKHGIRDREKKWGQVLASAGIAILTMSFVRDLAVVYFGFQPPSSITIGGLIFSGAGVVVYAIVLACMKYAFPLDNHREVNDGY